MRSINDISHGRTIAEYNGSPEHIKKIDRERREAGIALLLKDLEDGETNNDTEQVETAKNRLRDLVREDLSDAEAVSDESRIANRKKILAGIKE